MDTLAPGQRLSIGEELISSSGDYRLVMQSDGNLVLYESASMVVWATNTWNIPADHRPTHAIMQEDGNFVLYSDSGVPGWASGSNGGGGRHLVLQDDRNVVIYENSGHPVWATNTTYVPRALTQFEKDELVGYLKRVRTKGSLASNGTLSADVFTENRNWTTGLRGKVLVVVFDRFGNAIWVSKEFTAATRCSVPDVSCASSGQQTWIETFPQAIGKYAERVEIHQADTPSYVNLRNEIIDAIKTVTDIEPSIKDAWGLLIK